MANKKTSALTSYTNPDRTADVLPIVDVANSELKKITPNSLLGITGHPVGNTDTQTLTNKTLTAPNISSPKLSGTTSGTYTIGGTPTFPSTVVSTTGSQTLTNKVLTSPTINTATISNPTLTINSISEYTAANGVTIDGLNIKDSALNTSNSVPNNAHNNTGAWGSSWALTSYTPTFTNLTVGNGTHSSGYTQIGKMVYFYLKFTFGSTSAISGGVNITSLPVTPKALTAADSVGFGLLVDSGTAEYPATFEYQSSTSVSIYVQNASGTYLTHSALSSTVPFTWTTNDRLTGWIIYEAA
jgi:hypothetical protein